MQYEALRTVLGVLRCTPTYLLEAEEDILPLSLRRCFLMSHYFYRILGTTNNPLSRLTLSYRPLHHLIDRSLLSFTGRMHVESELLSLPLTDVPPLSLAHRYPFLNFQSSLILLSLPCPLSQLPNGLYYFRISSLSTPPARRFISIALSIERLLAVGHGAWSSSFQLNCTPFTVLLSLFPSFLALLSCS